MAAASPNVESQEAARRDVSRSRLLQSGAPPAPPGPAAAAAAFSAFPSFPGPLPPPREGAAALGPGPGSGLGPAGLCGSPCSRNAWIEQEGAITRMDFNYVGPGGGGYEPAVAYTFVGEGCGRYRKSTKVIHTGWRLGRHSWMLLLLATLIAVSVLFSGFCRRILPGASQASQGSQGSRSRSQGGTRRASETDGHLALPRSTSDGSAQEASKEALAVAEPFNCSRTLTAVRGAGKGGAGAQPWSPAKRAWCCARFSGCAEVRAAQVTANRASDSDAQAADTGDLQGQGRGQKHEAAEVADSGGATEAKAKVADMAPASPAATAGTVATTTHSAAAHPAGASAEGGEGRGTGAVHARTAETASVPDTVGHGRVELHT